MKNEIYKGLSGNLARAAEDASKELFTKQEILYFSKYDLERAEEALAEWETRGAVTLLANIQASPLGAIVLRVNLKRLNAIYYEDCANERAEFYRGLNAKERTEFLMRLDGSKLRAETLQYLDPIERAEALKRMDPTLRNEILPHLKSMERGTG